MDSKVVCADVDPIDQRDRRECRVSSALCTVEAVALACPIHLCTEETTNIRLHYVFQVRIESRVQIQVTDMGYRGIHTIELGSSISMSYITIQCNI